MPTSLNLLLDSQRFHCQWSCQPSSSHFAWSGAQQWPPARPQRRMFSVGRRFLIETANAPSMPMRANNKTNRHEQ
jgi:hypothetical protein